jgi:hypothetical protein
MRSHYRTFPTAVLCAWALLGAGGAARANPPVAELSDELARLQGEVQQKNRQIAALLRRYKAQGAAVPESLGPDLSEAERRVLAERYEKERVSLKALLQDIVQRDQTIAALERKLATLESGGATRRPPDSATRAERDAARAEAATLRGKLANVTREHSALQAQLTTLRHEISRWIDEADGSRQDARAAREGARYLAGSKKDLREHGVLSGGFLRRASVRRLEHLEVLDLTKGTDIVLWPHEYGLDRIRNVRVLPEGFERDQDYAVQVLRDGEMARLSLLDVNKFQRSTFIVVLE